MRLDYVQLGSRHLVWEPEAPGLLRDIFSGLHLRRWLPLVFEEHRRELPPIRDAGEAIDAHMGCVEGEGVGYSSVLEQQLDKVGVIEVPTEALPAFPPGLGEPPRPALGVLIAGERDEPGFNPGMVRRVVGHFGGGTWQGDAL